MKQSKIVTLPGTDFWVLEDDTLLPPIAQAMGTISIEEDIASLPEVRALSAKDIVVDVGAFIGDTPLIFAKSGAMVIGFEPQLDAYTCAVHNTQGVSNITLHNVVVGNGEGGLAIGGYAHPDNLGARHVGGVGSLTSVKLDDIIKRVTFLKIDVEGYELNVLRGAQKLLKTQRPIILMELSPIMLARFNHTVRDVHVFLEANQYSWRVCIGSDQEIRYDVMCKPIITYEEQERRR